MLATPRARELAACLVRRAKTPYFFTNFFTLVPFTSPT